jgi:hypothetical protein
VSTNLADEENVTAPAVASERLRVAWGLGDEFQKIIGPGQGLGFDPKNSPAQITRNLFVPGQPARQYNIGTTAAPVYQQVAVDAPLTVKRLVDAVYDEFDRSISRPEILKFVNGNLNLRKDRLVLADTFDDNGIFYQRVDINNVTAKGSFTRNMAFHILEKLNYIEMTPQAKQKLYNIEDGYNLDDGDDFMPGKFTFNGHTRTLDEWIESNDF